MKRWIIVCVLAAVFLVGANSFAPQLAEVGLSQALSAKFNLQTMMSASKHRRELRFFSAISTRLPFMLRILWPAI